jgi:hypothetical protein
MLLHRKYTLYFSLHILHTLYRCCSFVANSQMLANLKFCIVLGLQWSSIFAIMADREGEDIMDFKLSNSYL